MYQKLVLAVTLLASGGSPAVGAAGDPPSGAPHAVTPEQIQQWIADLDSDQFVLRQAASRKLRSCGLAAVKPLAAAADGRQSEVTRRAIDVLDLLCEEDDAEVAEAARDALEQLVHSAHRFPAHRASVVLRGQRLRQQRSALTEIQRLGGIVSYANVEDGELVVGLLVLGRRWEAGDEGLKYLAKLGRVGQLKLYGPQFTDEGLVHLGTLAGVQLLKLYATEISDDGHRRLQERLPGTQIDRRHGALLGVSGVPDVKGCRITVRAGTAAERAGIETEDVITSVDGEAVPDLQSLIAIIAKQKPGDRIRVSLLRDDRLLEKEVVLGELGEDTE